jgi:hypothetical protein
MNRSILLIAALFAALGLGACEKPTVVNVPAPVAVPGPAGPQGTSGTAGTDGGKGEPGKAGEGTTVIVMPPASAPTN